MRGGVLLLLMLVTGCRRERTHPRLAELTTPVHVTVRTVDLPPDCDALNGVEKLTCTTDGARDGCTFAAVGRDAELPLSFTGPMLKWHCDEQVNRRQTVMLVEQPLKAARLWADARGERVVIDLDTHGWVLFLHDGKLANSRRLWDEGASLRPLLADGTPDWPKVPTLLATWDTTGALLIGLTLQEVMKEDPDPQENLTRAMVGEAFRYDDQGFDDAFALLDPAHQEKVVVATLDHVKSGEVRSWWFRRRPELLPRYHAALLVALRDEQLTAPEALNDLLGLERAPLQSTACTLLEHSFLESGASEPSPAALALIAKQRLTCPWVTSWLERLRCDLRLTCKSEDDVFSDTERRLPLCSSAQIDEAMRAAFYEVPVNELMTSENFVLDEHVGELLLAAAAVQGPLPADFVKRSARRAYAGVVPSECSALPRPVGEWACGLPTTLTVSTQENCRLTLDDAKQTMAFEVTK